MNLLLLLMAVGVACSDEPMNLLLLLMAVGVACTVAPDALLNGEKILDIRRILCGSLTKDCLPIAPLLVLRGVVMCEFDSGRNVAMETRLLG